MKQYLKLLEQIQHKGTLKTPARENMPSTLSLFGYQFRHDLKDGFPLLTTKELSFKNIAVELLWFLNGDTNIKYLIDNGCNIWNEDAYHFYCKQFKRYNRGPNEMFTFEEFVKEVKNDNNSKYFFEDPAANYKLGDCGFQYGKVWRKWQSWMDMPDVHPFAKGSIWIDQIGRLIQGLKNNPQSRRHIVTAIDPANDESLALYWCHCMMQFNCRPLAQLERAHYAINNAILHRNELMFPNEYEDKTLDEQLDEVNIPKYYLDCQMYQRSADVFLGVPYNIASYALLTHIIAKMVNMVPGEYIHTFGDVHIYSNHTDQVEEQLGREPKPLPSLLFKDEFHYIVDKELVGEIDLDTIIREMKPDWFTLKNYTPHPRIKAKLSTGLK